ncbi:SDR family NAD(P)-dependent oxidoreductase [Candidatus Haliotispira prima]|uniref:SDR family NAD(P)-dependent oxidoreductase n=1 Tax=Candidatus Haliotispira prima TaxID=3034016 RepID=A0ABY8MK58_9SPIO|nr:SDR family NAD(P)-dependent oxidoreductase [Candidatus Haliotispira prima]
MKLAKKTIWITGSSGGIGLAMAQQAVREGAATVVLSGSNAEKLANAAALCRDIASQQSTPCKILCLRFDISKTDEINRAAEQYRQQLDHLDVLVHNAGVSQRTPMLNTTHAVERYLMEVNYWGAVTLTKLLLPKMLENQHCYIGVTSSVTGLFGVPLRTSYCAGKHALNGYFMALQAEYYQKGLRVTLLCPGKINTEISKSALMGDGTSLGIIEKGHEKGLSAKRCAAIFWSAAKRGRLICYAVRLEALAIWLHRLSPQLGSALIRKALPLREDALEQKAQEARERSHSRW